MVKKKKLKLIATPLIIFSHSIVLTEIREHIKTLEKRIIYLREKLIEEKTKNDHKF